MRSKFPHLFMVFLILGSLFLSTEKARAHQTSLIPDYRLPFDVDVKIFQGPKCKPSHMHSEAIDFGLADGTPVYAAMDGLLHSGWDSHIVGGWSFGNYIEIKDAANDTAIYAHLSKIFVQSGKVRQGDLIGLSGNSSAGDKDMGYHLHFEVRGPENQQIPIRNLPGIVWTDPRQPCLPDEIDGKAYGSVNKDQLLIYYLSIFANRVPK